MSLIKAYEIVFQLTLIKKKSPSLLLKTKQKNPVSRNVKFIDLGVSWLGFLDVLVIILFHLCVCFWMRTFSTCYLLSKSPECIPWKGWLTLYTKDIAKIILTISFGKPYRMKGTKFPWAVVSSKLLVVFIKFIFKYIMEGFDQIFLKQKIHLEKEE